MNTKELYSIREWAPLTVIERIPARLQRGLGLFPVDLNITSVDAVTEFLALGSDAGVVFWYNRHTGEMQKLKAELASRITCVKIVNSVEYMVAAGNAAGQVSVFQIQKQLPADLNLVAPCTRAKPIERYTIRDLHHSSVSCCEWSKNGMKLFSGDRQGVVVFTEFDYQTHLSKSAEILNEAYEIVQLSVYQSYLLVSSLYRSIICQRSNSNGQWHITQVGKKDRKQLLDCGGTFLKRNAKRPFLICGRPGLRFWIADTEGNVEKTLLFRDAVARSPTWEIPILNPKNSFPRAMNTLSFNMPISSATGSTSDTDVTISLDTKNFREMYLYAGEDSLLVTHDESTLYVLNLDLLRVEAVARGFRKILDFSVCEKEIFVLEGERSLLRLSPMPEKPNKTAKIIFNPLMPPPVPVLGAATCGTFESPVEFNPDAQFVINAEEVFELPPIETLNLNIPIELAVESPRAAQNRRLEIFNKISQMDFDQSILHSSGYVLNGRKKRCKSREHKLSKEVHCMTKSQGIVEIGHAAVKEDNISLGHAAVEEEEGKQIKTHLKKENVKPVSPHSLELTTKPTAMDVSYCGAVNKDETDQGTLLTDFFRPNIIQIKIEQKTGTLLEESDLSESGAQAPITQTYVIPPAPPPPTPAPFTEVSSSSVATGEANNPLVETLTQAYPQQTQVEDAGVQTTPRKKFYDVHDLGDYSDGQPVDDICTTQHVSSLIEGNDLETASAIAAPAAASNVSAGALNLHFVATQPLQSEIDSFLLDFRRARDPLRKSPPPSTESNASSEWEFLDN